MFHYRSKDSRTKLLLNNYTYILQPEDSIKHRPPPPHPPSPPPPPPITPKHIPQAFLSKKPRHFAEKETMAASMYYVGQQQQQQQQQNNETECFCNT